MRGLVLGCTFKPDVKDLRNSKVFDVIRELESYTVRVDVHDPVVGLEAMDKRGLNAVENPWDGQHSYQAVLLAVPHAEFKQRSVAEFESLVPGGVLIDLKGALDGESVSVSYWRL